MNGKSLNNPLRGRRSGYPISLGQVIRVLRKSLPDISSRKFGYPQKIGFELYPKYPKSIIKVYTQTHIILHCID
jgi:hypothetical protein